jgi:peptidase E
MSGYVLVQGGDEFHDECREMDKRLLELAGSGRVTVLAGASESAADFEATSQKAVAYYRDLGAPDVEAAPQDHDGMALALISARVAILPGGSPAHLLHLLHADQGRLSDALRAILLAGGAISGSSAGAMVLGAATWLPDADREGTVVPALGLLGEPLLLLPHADGTPSTWLSLVDQGRALLPDLRCLALGEHSGVLFGPEERESFGSTWLWE